jgi:hypothetical protein
MKRTRRLDQTGPLYKLEWYDSTLLVWRPIQRLYASIEDAARITRTDDRQWRLLEVSSHGYAPVPLPR